MNSLAHKLKVDFLYCENESQVTHKNDLKTPILWCLPHDVSSQSSENVLFPSYSLCLEQI